jgi:putative CocE/NonD family hydrolase
LPTPRLRFLITFLFLEAPVLKRSLVRLLVLVFLAMPALAQENGHDKELAEFIKANYTKYEFRIAMRDGARLFTAVYVPKDASAANLYPILLLRTPYSVGPYGEDNYPERLGPSELFARAKYIFAYQDVRGRFMSEGDFEDMRPYLPNKRSNKDVDESSDTYDTIDWLVKNVHFNNGKVGQWGISYPGFYTAMGLIDAHPALKASSPQAPIADWFIGDDFHHNGALWLPHMFNFMAVFGKPRPELTTKWGPRFDEGTQDGYNWFLANAEPLTKIEDLWYKHDVRFWENVIAHPNYDDFWKGRSVPQYLKNIQPAVLVVGGWFDAEDLYGALHTYEAVARNNPAQHDTLVMGPWFHGGWSRTAGDHLGPVRFNAKTGDFFREHIEFPFFEAHLKGKESAALPAAYVFETGHNQWRQYDAWPPRNAEKKTLYFLSGGKLSFTPPVAGEAWDEYVSDPAKPVPYVDQTNIGMLREYMSADQRLQGRRTDVLVYQTAPLKESITIAGPLQPDLWVSTSGTDSDFIVKLIDVYPPEAPNPDPNPAEVQMGEYQQLVRGEPFRGRFRNGFDKPEPFVPGKAARVEFVMPDVNHTFLRGHRIMVQVQSTWFPLVDLNPQKFVDIYHAQPGDFQKATERVYHSPQMPSGVNVTVLPE